jgi:predicted metal-dependent enzyme (double-stranded beta helix superfamily)
MAVVSYQRPRNGDPATYRCHLLHAEPDGSFSVVALVWRPGQATPIHDHVTWCVFVAGRQGRRWCCCGSCQGRPVLAGAIVE